ncbi:MAG: hypothetical protein U1A81_02150 [Hydrogenophaga sp.]|nr:hypothetical protein [Hydrogenophaga sp.]
MMNDKPNDKRPQPLTAAQRQQRHRAKRKAAYAALLAQATTTGPVATLQRENESLRSALETSQRKQVEQAAKLKALTDQQPGMRDQLEALRRAIRSTLVQLSPASVRVARKHLAETGFIEWLDAD